MSTIFHLSEMVSLAFHSMILIAGKNKEWINVKQISSMINASEFHLSKVLQRLVKANFIRSVRGPKGGFALIQSPEEITLLDIYQAIEGPLLVKTCPCNYASCPFESCIFGGLPEKLSKEWMHYLSTKKLSDFLPS